MNAIYKSPVARMANVLGLCLLGLFLPIGARAQEVPKRPAVVLISIDGLRPDYVLEADKHGLRIPNLRKLLREGAYATGVHGVLPTVTYPSHTTMLTGVSPAKHGIYANTTFDPLKKNQGGWYWYAEDIRVPTLWDAAGEAGLVTMNVHWPVSVGAHIRWNLPQYWRAQTEDDRKLLRALSTPGLIEALERELGPYGNGGDESVDGDETRARFAERLIEIKRPGFSTVYFAGLDHEEHNSGPFSPESQAVLERIDAGVGRVVAATQRTFGARAVVCIVSDHGFVRTDKAVNLNATFRNAGLIEFDEKGGVKSWKAAIWGAGGSAAIILRDKNDAETKSKVAAILTQLARRPENGIERVFAEEDHIYNDRGFPDAAFVVTLRLGYVIGQEISGELVTPTKTRGMHGYWPDLPEMYSSFFIAGAGISAGRSLGEIDMRDIAPTLARILGVRLAAAEGKPLF